MADLILTQADDGGRFEAASGATLTVRLAENPTTGFRWAIDEAEETILALVRSELEQPHSPRVGQGGMRVLTFRAERPGTTPLHLKHWREWEGDRSVIDRFAVTLVVTP